MKLTKRLICALSVITSFSAAAADEAGSVILGKAEVYRDYQLTEKGTAVLTLNAVVSETNNSLRGLKNSDQQRLKKLGQLIYQCKLMLYKAGEDASTPGVNDPFLISKNYSLFTGVDMPLAANERVGIRARALQSVDDDSLFTPTLGGKQSDASSWDTLGENSAINLRQLDVNLVDERDLIEGSESIDFTIRFPVFQVKKPVRQWSYHFELKDFKRARQYIDQNCTPVRLVELINRNG